jgi:L-lactate dehydrogenase complex protein LldG
MSSARKNILQRLRSVSRETTEPLSRPVERRDWDQPERVERFIRHMEEVRAEIHRSSEEAWPEELCDILRNKGVARLAHGQGQDDFARLEEQLASHQIEAVPYREEIEAWKPSLFDEVDAGFTSCAGAIAETGSLIIWPSESEPRLLSLIPPIHCLVLRSNQIYTTFAEAMEDQAWASQMPTNPLLISGPSKSADIAQVLAYGVHGPRSLVIMLLE